MLNDMLRLQKRWDKDIHWRKLISCKQKNQTCRKGMPGAVFTGFSHCKMISQMRNQCCNTTLKGEVMYVCSCPNSIASSMQLRCYGGMQNIASFPPGIEISF